MSLLIAPRLFPRAFAHAPRPRRAAFRFFLSLFFFAFSMSSCTPSTSPVAANLKKRSSPPQHAEEPDHKFIKIDDAAAGAQGAKAVVVGAVAGAMEVEITSTAECAAADAGAAVELAEEGTTETEKASKVASGGSELAAAAKVEEAENEAAAPTKAAESAEVAKAKIDAPKEAAVAKEVVEEGTAKGVEHTVVSIASAVEHLASTCMAEEEETGGQPAADAAPMLIIRVRDWAKTDMFFKVRTTTKMSAVFSAWEARKGLCSVFADPCVKFLSDGERVQIDDTPESLGLVDQDVIICTFNTTKWFDHLSRSHMLFPHGLEVSGYRGPDRHIHGLMGKYEAVKDKIAVFQLVDGEGAKQDAFLQRKTFFTAFRGAPSRRWLLGKEKQLEAGLSMIASSCFSSEEPIAPIGLAYEVWSHNMNGEEAGAWLFDASLQVSAYQTAAQKAEAVKARFEASARDRQRISAKLRMHEEGMEQWRTKECSSFAITSEEASTPYPHGIKHDRAMSVLAKTPYLDMICTTVTRKALGSLLSTCKELAGVRDVAWSKAKGRRILGCPTHMSIVNVGAEIIGGSERNLRTLKFWKEGTVRDVGSFGAMRVLSASGNPHLLDIMTGANQGLTRAELDKMGPFRKQKLDTRACMLDQPNAIGNVSQRDGRIKSLLVPIEVHAPSLLDVAASCALDTAWCAAEAALDALEDAWVVAAESTAVEVDDKCSENRRNALTEVEIDDKRSEYRRKAFEARDSIRSPSIPISYLVTHQGIENNGLRIFDYSAKEWFSLFASKGQFGETWAKRIHAKPTDEEIDQLSQLYDYDLRDPTNSAIASTLVESWRELEPSGPLGKRTFFYRRDDGDRAFGPCGSIYGLAWLPRMKRLAVGFQDGVGDGAWLEVCCRCTTLGEGELTLPLRLYSFPSLQWCLSTWTLA